MPTARTDRRNLVLVATAICLALAGVSQLYAEAPPPLDATLKQMLTAIQTDSFDQFVAPGDAAFKAAMTKPMLEHVGHGLAARLKAGYTATYLGALNQMGFAVHLWKLEFKGGGDDVLVTMSVKDGKVGGFWLR